MLVIHQPHFRAPIFVCGIAWGKRGRDPLLPNLGWSFPLTSQRTRNYKLLECSKPRHRLFAEAKDVTQTTLTSGQSHPFLSCFSKHRKASTPNMVTFVAGSFSRQLPSVSWLGTEALLFYFPLPGKSVSSPDGSKEGSVGQQPAVTFCKKSMAWWAPRITALMSVQWPHH